jgi:hypothetical protein
MSNKTMVMPSYIYVHILGRLPQDVDQFRRQLQLNEVLNNIGPTRSLIHGDNLTSSAINLLANSLFFSKIPISNCK